jgi:hypothetical protein
MTNVGGHHFRYLLFLATAAVISYHTISSEMFYRSNAASCVEHNRVAKIVQHLQPVMSVESQAKVVWLMSCT